MGKIRVKALGDEQSEKEQKAEAKRRAEQKRIEEAKAKAKAPKEKGGLKTEETLDSANARHSGDEQREESRIDAVEATNGEAKPEKKQKKEKFLKKKTGRSENYKKVLELIDRNKTYKLGDAVALLPKLKLAKFDETVELHMNMADKGVSGSVTLPHGTGKQVRVTIANAGQDAAGLDALIKSIEGGKIDFDVLIATPDSMPKLARVAKFLGPRGLMPNPKNGTVSPKPEEVAKRFAGGQINFKTEAKFPILHMSVGKVSFGDQKLEENIKVAIRAVEPKNIKDATLKSTMSPGIKLDVSTI